jgi:release factor glutamine methyltransferase
VANPPYLTEQEYQALDPSVRCWEPRAALASGADGLGETRRLVHQAAGLLGRGGWLVMELDSNRSAAVATLAREAGWVDVAVWDDLFGRPRYLTARREQAG